MIVQHSFGLTPHWRQWRSLVWEIIQQSVRQFEPVELIEQHYNFLPRRFRWHGHEHVIRRIVCSWDRNDYLQPRRFFEVECHNGANYRLFQDLRIGAWYVC